MSRRVLVVAAHADDEILGCGGTMARHSADGDHVSTLFMTNGVGSRETAEQDDIDRRRNAMETALGLVGVKHHALMDFPDNALDQVPLLDIAKAIENAVAQWGIPDIVYTHHPGDLNIDHQLTHRAVMTCFRPQPSVDRTVAEILTFEVLSSTAWYGVAAEQSFCPNYFVDITATLETKLKALEAYSGEMRPWPHSRSVETSVHLARFRGATMGMEAAEAFVVERIVRSA